MNLSDLRAPEGQKQHAEARSARVWAPAAANTPAAAPRARSRSPATRKMRGFEGGQMPLHRRLPKRGFTNIFRKEYAVINLGRLNELEGDTFDFDSLKQLGVVKKLQDGLKVLGTGELTRAITVTAHVFSASAKEKIEAAGGKAVSWSSPPGRQSDNRALEAAQ